MRQQKRIQQKLRQQKLIQQQHIARLRPSGYPVRVLLTKLSFVLPVLMLAALASAYGQYSNQTFKLEQLSAQYDQRGFLGGQAINVDGKLAVSTANGGVSYSYTIDNFTESGYAFNVGLNYCGSVALSSFKEYHSGTAEGGPEIPDYWDKFTRNHPVWIISVNDFAVQTLTLVSDYLPPVVAGRTELSASELPWLIEGYDFTNVMKRMETTGDNDVIKLLRGDGSVLELRNPYRKNTNTVADYELVTGYYFEDAINARGFAYVDFDTTALPAAMRTYVDSLISSPQGQIDTNHWKTMMYQYLPRVVRYYPGDGLEYRFVEHLMPYSSKRYNADQTITGGRSAGPRICYLRDIRNASTVVLDLEYYRHNRPDDGSPGRAPLKRIGSVQFRYSDLFVVAEARGRTTSLQLEKNLPFADFVDPDGGPYAGKDSYIGLVKTLRDPENRTTDFQYSPYWRKFEDYEHPENFIQYIEVSSRRLTNIKEPTAEYSISYHEDLSDRTIVYDPNEAPPVILANWKLNNVAHRVKKYDRDHVLQTTETYCFTGLSTVDEQKDGCSTMMPSSPETLYTLKDNRTGETRTIGYTFHKFELARLNPQSVPHPLAHTLVHTEVTDVVETADGKSVHTQTQYAQQGGGALILPVSVEQEILPGGHRNAHIQTSYITRAGHGYGGPATVANYHTLKVEKKTETVRTPDVANAVYVKNITEYLNLALLAPQNVGAVRWNKTASGARHDSLYRAGILYSSVFEMPDSLQVFDTLDVEPFYAPPHFGLVQHQYQEGPTGNYLGGTKRVYELSSIAPRYNTRGLPLRDSLIAAGQVSAELVSEYTYGYDGASSYGMPWAFTDERLPVQLVNGNGATIAQSYRYRAGLHLPATRLNEDGTTESIVLKDHLRGLGVEKPLVERSLVRNARTGLVDTLVKVNEYTHYGLLRAQRDLNGYYSLFDYDDNGRLRTARLPMDFLGAQAVCNERVDGELEYKAPLYWTDAYLDSVVYTCPYEIVSTSATVVRHHTKLTPSYDVFARPCYDILNTSLVQPSGGENDRTGKRGQEQVLLNYTPTIEPERFLRRRTEVATCRFENQGADNIFDAVQTLRSGSFAFFVSASEGRCFTFEVLVRRTNTGAVLAKRTYVLSCNNAGHSKAAFGGGGKKDQVMSGSGSNGYEFTIPFTSAEMEEIARPVAGGIEVVMWVSTPGVSMSIADDEDKRPRWKLDGVFDLPVEQQQYTLQYEYSTGLDAYVVQRVKTDDGHTSFNYPAGCRSMRYSEVQHDLGADRLVEKSTLVIGDPTQPIRTDSTTSAFAGLGMVRTTTDQEGYSMWTEYDAWGRPVKTTNPDSTYIETVYAFGAPANLLPDATQDFYGYCESITTIPSGNQVPSIQYFDAFGRLRREVSDSLYKDSTTTKYEYDNLNRLTMVISPAGDTTRYWYDEYGRVKYKYQPDMGYISYAYDALGNVRFVQTEQQATDGRVTFTEYDDLGRIVLVGEARLTGEPGGGGHGGIQGMGKKEQAMNTPPSGRLTDQLDGRYLHDGSVSAAVTANATVWQVPSVALPSFWTLGQLSETMCRPQPDTEPLVTPLLSHPADSYNDPGLPLATLADFENIAMYPGNARVAVHYDTLPVPQGAVWQHFPAQAQWDALAPTGAVRNLKGREAATAYRGHAGEPYHFTVMSYDERGRVEALLRYTENLGFDAVYYTYNAMNAITSIRAVDPQRQSTTWYGYDWNGRVDSVWSLVSPAGTGLGLVNPAYVAAPVKPETADIGYSYTKRGQVQEMVYPPVQTLVRYAYNPRALLDSMTATVNGTQQFVHALDYNVLGWLSDQQWQHAGQSRKTGSAEYNGAGRNPMFLRSWVYFDGATTHNESYNYDLVGNRTLYSSISGTDLHTSSYQYADPDGPNRLTAVRDSVLQNGTMVETAVTGYSYNADGAMTGRSWSDGTTSRTETFSYDNVQGLLLKYTRTDGALTADWRYRYSAGGEREQKRLYTLAQQPIKTWDYYLLDGAKRQLAVYHGVETEMTNCGQTLTPYAYLAAGEYLVYGQGSIHNLTAIPTGAATVRKEYKIQDYLGTTRLVVEPDGMGGGTITGRYDHGPWGETVWQNAPERRLSFIDKERDEESGDHNFGMRQYNNEAGRFFTTDALWEQYPSLSPYQYAANNPFTYVDPTGAVIQFAEGTSAAFIEDYNMAIEYLKQSETGRAVIEYLEASEEVYTIRETFVGNSKYKYGSKTVLWNANDGLYVVDNNGNRERAFDEKGRPMRAAQTPAMGLMHEFVHAYLDATEPEKVTDRLYTEIAHYDTEEEKYIIENFEAKIIDELNKKLKKIQEVKRHNHDSESYETRGPITTEPR